MQRLNAANAGQVERSQELGAQLNEMYLAEKISDVKQDMSKMEDIFRLQEMYEHKSREGKIEEELKKMGYIN